MEFIQPNPEQLHKHEDTVKKYFNKAQRDAMVVSAHDEYFIASRGTGKSEGIDARAILQNVWSMPGSTGALLSPTYAKAWGNTLPAICHALAAWGYVEGIHYYVGRKAPADKNFKQPKRKPLREAWQNCFHFWNGTVMVVLSFNQGMSANSMSLDWVIGPEAKFLSYDKIKSEVNPANRGNKQYFDYSPFHHRVTYSTDMPTSKMGKWILEKENEMDNAHINYIRNLYKKKKDFEKLEIQTEYTKREIKLLESDLNQARKFQKPIIPIKGKDKEHTVYYAEYDIFDNLEVVGEDYIWQMYRDSPALIWRTAFLNERLFRVPNGFYSALTDDHFYIAPDAGGIQNLDVIGISKQTNWKKISTSGCLGDGDLDINKPLYIGCDSNAAISTLCVGQVDEERHEMKTIMSMFVKTPGKLQDVVQAFCDYYMPLLRKEVIFYYDHTFMWTTGTNPDSYKDTVIKVLNKNRWNVTDVYIGQSPGHDWKHMQIDKSLKGDPEFYYPTFNMIHNEFLKIAMEQTGVKQGKNGFEKDKKPEHTPDTPDAPDEHKTHVTDAWDTLWYGINYYYRSPHSDYFGAVFIGQ